MAPTHEHCLLTFGWLKSASECTGCPTSAFTAELAEMNDMVGRSVPQGRHSSIVSRKDSQISTVRTDPDRMAGSVVNCLGYS